MKITVDFESLGEFMAFGRLIEQGAPAPSPAPGPAPTPAPAPAPTPPAYVPQARVLTMPARAVAGTLRWITDDTTYLCAVVTNGDVIIAGLWSASGAGDAVQMTRLETMCDSGLDTKPPDTSDAGLRTWLGERILPPLNAWAAANPARLAGAVFLPVSNDPIPAAWNGFDRAAAVLAQGIKLGPLGFVVAA